MQEINFEDKDQMFWVFGNPVEIWRVKRLFFVLVVIFIIPFCLLHFNLRQMQHVVIIPFRRAQAPLLVEFEIRLEDSFPVWQPTFSGETFPDQQGEGTTAASKMLASFEISPIFDFDLD